MSVALRLVRAPPRPLVEDEDPFLLLLAGVVSVGIDGVVGALNAGSIKSSLTTTGDAV